MSDYTPSVDEARARYVDVCRDTDQCHLCDEVGAEFDRMIAQVRAEVLRGAAQALRMGLRGSACNEGCHKADRITLEMWADRIEKEAGLK